MVTSAKFDVFENNFEEHVYLLRLNDMLHTTGCRRRYSKSNLTADLEFAKLFWLLLSCTYLNVTDVAQSEDIPDIMGTEQADTPIFLI